jgi:uncharacterized protein
MSLTALNLSPEALKKYHPLEAIRKRREVERPARAKRRRRAMVVARKAAKLLKEEFGSKEVILFGSLAKRGAFTRWSDIDLAVKKIPRLRYFEAVAKITRLDVEFSIDLVELENCPSSLVESIEKDGKPL